MTTWLNERLLRRPKTKDSLRSRTRDVQDPGGRTFEMSLSSVKRYVNRAGPGESLAAKKSPGSPQKLDEKARKLLEGDLEKNTLLPAYWTAAAT
jgi:transposase